MIEGFNKTGETEDGIDKSIKVFQKDFSSTQIPQENDTGGPWVPKNGVKGTSQLEIKKDHREENVAR